MIHDPDLSIEPNNVGPREHELKTWPEFFIEVIAGRKPFEVRFNDRDYHEGDTLWLREWSPTLAEYTGRDTRQRVTYVMGGRFGIDPEYVVMGLKPVASAVSRLDKLLETGFLELIQAEFSHSEDDAATRRVSMAIAFAIHRAAVEDVTAGGVA